jgi:pyroglutamyl-peptidase
MKKILLTGFEPFHKSNQNPSQEIVREVENVDSLSHVETLVLPVEFGRAAEILCKKIVEIQPDVVICLGQAEGRSAITPEQVAINIDDARIPDNSGNQPNDNPIVAGGPDAYFSTLPIKKLIKVIEESGAPASISLSAGTFVCNHVFYAVQHFCRDKNIQSGFIHVPLMESQKDEFPGLPTLNLEVLVKAIKAVIKALS